jgi:hypothetical protein
MTHRIVARIVVIVCALAMIGLMLCKAHGQELPDAPKPHLLSPDHVVLAYAITGRALDVWSTNQFLGRGGREVILPATVVNHTALTVGFEAVVLGAEWFGARELRKHGHRQLARMVFALDGSMCLATDVHNFQIQRVK